jgi:hypothetical protein
MVPPGTSGLVGVPQGKPLGIEENLNRYARKTAYSVTQGQPFPSRTPFRVQMPQLAQPLSKLQLHNGYAGRTGAAGAMQQNMREFGPKVPS